jgi:hypothetical protein
MFNIRPETRALPLGLAIGLALVLPAASAPAEELPFSEARLFFELNDTDGDLGIHASIDGEPWKTLTIEDLYERTVLRIGTAGRVRQQGLTQLSFESAEPSFDELEPEEFFERFPAGIYEVGGMTLEGDEMEAEVTLSHRLPGPPQNVRVNGLPAAENCDASNIPLVSPPVVISWDPVTQAHPELGESGPVTVERYQVFAEQIGSGDLKFSLDLPPTMTQYMVSPELIALGDSRYKFEVQVREQNGNQTAIESCFDVR